MVFGFAPSDLVPFFYQRGVLAPTSFAISMLIVTLIAYLTIMGTLRFDPSSPIALRRILAAVSLAAVAALLCVPILVFAVDLNVFGFVQLVWNCLVFAVAPAALSLLVWGPYRRRLTGVAFAAALAGLSIWPAAAYARFIEPYRLQLERVPVEIEAQGRSIPPLRIGVLADLQTDRITAYEHNVVDRLLAEKPDFILIPGDLFHGGDREFFAELPAFNALLRRLEAPRGVYFVTGDVDLPANLEALFEGTSIGVVDNRIVRFEAGGISVELVGLAGSGGLAEAARRAATDLMEGANSEALQIGFAHHPEEIDRFPEGSRLDLFVAGHTHGGQVVLPLIGPPVTLSSVPRVVGAGGLHRLRGHSIYVSRGAGMERGQAPRMRFLCPPEVTLLELVVSSKSSPSSSKPTTARFTPRMR